MTALVAVAIWEFSELVPSQTAFAESKVKVIARPSSQLTVPRRVRVRVATVTVTNFVITGLITIWRVKNRPTIVNSLDALYLGRVTRKAALYPFALAVTLIFSLPGQYQRPGRREFVGRFCPLWC